MQVHDWDDQQKSDEDTILRLQFLHYLQYRVEPQRPECQLLQDGIDDLQPATESHTGTEFRV